MLFYFRKFPSCKIGIFCQHLESNVVAKIFIKILQVIFRILHKNIYLLEINVKHVFCKFWSSWKHWGIFIFFYLASSLWSYVYWVISTSGWKFILLWDIKCWNFLFSRFLLTNLLVVTCFTVFLSDFVPMFLFGIWITIKLIHHWFLSKNLKIQSELRLRYFTLILWRSFETLKLMKRKNFGLSDIFKQRGEFLCDLLFCRIELWQE